MINISIYLVIGRNWHFFNAMLLL